MGFPEFTNPAGLQSLEAHLADKSYIEGYTPSQADVAVYKALASAPDAATYPRSARWFKHIQSYEAEHETLPGDASKPASAYGSAVAAAAAPAAAEDEDDIDLFGSDDEEVDPEAEALKQKRLAEYAAKKANKPKTIAKSLVTLDVKPWDDETDMAQLEANVRAIEKPGLVWGLSKLVPIGYGIKKLQMSLVVEDELVSLDELQDQIAEDEEHSSDVAAMQKL
ncbi:Elongation factor 1-beta [Rhodotorula toruloides]|uniref:Elongation factor 1-beta n=1 Tax=Rhodotorula toruloides TaxID=5286 RepID=A0A0K3CLT6_RHOTO|nr:Elongation factor 1-beta [Rhodotorula toruloides]